jgi:hypothetical protein
MSERTVTAESVRVSRAAQHAAEIAAAAQERARMARIERLERDVGRAINSLGAVMATLWLIGLGVVLAWEYLP